MARYGSDRVGFFLVGGYDLKGSLTQFTFTVEGILEESHTLGDSFREQSFVGVKQAQIGQSGYFEDGAGNAHDAAEAHLATSPVMCLNVEGNVSGANFYGLAGAMEVNYDRILARDELTKAEANYNSNGIVEQGRILRPLTSASSTAGNTTAAGIDFTASNVSGGAAYLQVTELANCTATGLQVDVLHSADNLSYTSWLGFAAVTATAPSAQRIASTAVLQRYAAVIWTAATANSSLLNHKWFVGLARA